jgi:hypothetical protein
MKDDAAMRIARALVQAKADFPKVRPGGVFTICDAAECIRKQLAVEFPEACKMPRVLVNGRDEVFDALAVASGVPASSGLVAGAVGGLVAAVFGGSPMQVTGPAAALNVMVLAIATRYGTFNVVAEDAFYLVLH